VPDGTRPRLDINPGGTASYVRFPARAIAPQKEAHQFLMIEGSYDRRRRACLFALGVGGNISVRPFDLSSIPLYNILFPVFAESGWRLKFYIL